jgi:putative nucleotidyltransferase with HDIG domain
MAGFKTVLANDGKEALALLKTCKPNLIVTDIYMPNMNGFELCQTLQYDQEYRSIPIIVMSTSFERSDMTRILQYGAAAYIVKPFHIDELVILVEKLLSDQYIILLKERENLEIERKLLLGSITSLISALEARDSYTRGHSEDVATVLCGIAEIAGESKEDIETLRTGGKLHDIGKIGVRDSVLLKPDKLTPEEFDHIKRHPVIGAEILKSIPTFSKIVPIVYSHHERIDGKGYPQGLKGSEIHRWARMTAVADTYDALVSDRPYRKGMPREKALQIIQDVKGSQLCPDSVELFMKWISTH